jgi:PAS domain S-box-containing protein
MIPRLRRWYCETLSPVFGYSTAVLLAAAPQIVRIPLHPATLMPFITYVPFVVASAALGGFGPGMLTTGICLLESLYFAAEPLGSFKMGDPRLWGGLGALAGIGLVASTLFESLKRAWRSNAAAAAADGATKGLVRAQDITERKQTEAELARQRDELRRQAELIYFSRDAIITADANRVIRGWNRGAEELYGWTEAETVGNVMHLFLRTSSVVSPAQIDECLARDERWEGELEHSRRDGQRILVDSRQVLLRDAAGTDVRIMEIDRDITQRRRAEDALKRSVRQLESALAEKTVLLKEIHHRVKNNLAVTASLLSMTADGSGPETRLALEESQQRVHSIALVHEYLYDNDRLDHINFGEYARDLVQGVYSAFGGAHKRIGLDLELDPIELGIERAVPCALILNELVSNAFKYAFADGRTGRILVSFRQPEPGCCELAVEDDGVGLPDGALGGQSKSLGLRIVGILTNQLDGSVEQKARSGTRIVLRFPAAA